MGRFTELGFVVRNRQLIELGGEMGMLGKNWERKQKAIKSQKPCVLLVHLINGNSVILNHSRRFLHMNALEIIL